MKNFCQCVTTFYIHAEYALGERWAIQRSGEYAERGKLVFGARMSSGTHTHEHGKQVLFSSFYGFSTI